MFITEGRINWKYLLIVAIWAVIVGGGIWVYFGDVVRNIISPSQFSEIPEVIPTLTEEESKNHILFARGNDLWSSDITGKDQKEILTNIELSGPVKFDVNISPDHQKILYFSGDDIYLSKSDGSNSRLVVKAVTQKVFDTRFNPPSEGIRYPKIVWASDSNAFLYIKSPPSNDPQKNIYQIYSIDLNTSKEQFIREMTTDYSSVGISFAGWDRTNNEIYTFRVGLVDGGVSEGIVINSLNGDIKNEYNITGLTYEVSPKYDKFILSILGPIGLPHKLTIRNIRTGEVLKTIEINIFPDKWSPDGEKILLVGGKILEIDSEKITKIFEYEGTGCGAVAWSPDSNYITYTSSPGNGMDTSLNVIKIDGSYKKEIIKEYTGGNCDRFDLGWGHY